MLLLDVNFILAKTCKNQTSHLKEVTGRDLAVKMVNIINKAIAEFEEQNKIVLHRDERGKITQYISLDVDDEGEYIIEAPRNSVSGGDKN